MARNAGGGWLREQEVDLADIGADLQINLRSVQTVLPLCPIEEVMGAEAVSCSSECHFPAETLQSLPFVLRTNSASTPWPKMSCLPF